MKNTEPFEGEVAPERVAMVARLLKDIGVQHVGVADPSIAATWRPISSGGVPARGESSCTHADLLAEAW